MLDGDSSYNKVYLSSFPVSTWTFLAISFFQIFEEKCTIFPLQPNLSFLKQIKFSSPKKKKKILTVIKFKKIYYFEGKIGDVEKNINFVKKKKMMIREER